MKLDFGTIKKENMELHKIESQQNKDVELSVKSLKDRMREQKNELKRKEDRLNESDAKIKKLEDSMKSYIDSLKS